MRKDPVTSNFVVVIIDMQDFFLRRFDAVVRKEVVANQQDIIDFCNKNGVPVVLVEYEGKGRGRTLSVLRNRIKKSLLVDVISKPNNSAFRDTDLEGLMKELKVRSMVLMGINASGCVQDTAIGALRRGYKIVTSRGVIASSSVRDKYLNTSKKWYSKKGKFFESPEALKDFLQKIS